MNHQMKFHFKLKVLPWFFEYQLLNGEIFPENGCSYEEPYHVYFSLHDLSRRYF